MLAGGAVKRVHKKQYLGTIEDFPTKRLAARELEQRLAHINSVEYKPTPTLTFKQFAEKWQTTVMVTHKPSTQRWEKTVIKASILPAFGSVQLRQVNAERVQEWVSGSAKAPKTVKNELFLMASMWETAKQWEYVKHDPFASIRLPIIPEADVYHFSVEEALRIIDAAEGWHKVFFRTLAETGMRPGEVAGLMWTDVAGRTLQIKRSVWRRKVQTPKTKTALRSPIISAKLAEMIDALPRTSLYVFSAEDGNPLDIEKFRERVLLPILKALKIEPKKRCGFYAFRHMNATLLDRLHTPVKTRQARLGHADARTTMGYTHFVSEDDAMVAEQLGALFNPTEGVVQ